MNLRPYAAGILISAGVFVTGTLWWTRTSPHIAAEDIAAIAADVWERNLAFFASSGPNARPADTFWVPWWYRDLVLEFSSNTVSTVRAHKILGQIATSLKLLVGPDIIEHLNYPTPVHWIDPTFDWTTPIATLPPVSWAHEDVEENGLAIRIWSASEVGDTAEIRLTTLDTRNVKQEQCFTIDDPVYTPLSGLVGGAYTLDPKGSWWEDAGLGPNLFVWPNLEHISEASTVSYRDHQIKTNALDDFRTLIASMNSAILVGNSGGAWWQCSDQSHRASIPYLPKLTYNDLWKYKVSNIPPYWTNEPPREGFFTDVITEFSGKLTEILNTTNYFSGAVPLPYPLARVHYDIKWTYEEETWTAPYTGTQMGYWGEVEAADKGNLSFRRYLDGVHCVWPHDWMYASNMISRVRYYAVYGRTGDSPTIPDPVRTDLPSIRGTSYEEYTVEWNANSVDTSMIAEEEFCGYTLSLPTISEIPTLSSSATAWDTINVYGRVKPAPEQWQPVLLADVSNPTKAPTVNIGPAQISARDEHTAMLYGEGEATLTKMDTEIQKSSTYTQAAHYYHDRDLSLYTLICVVDFKFSNYSSGGKGSFFVPPWATNAPSLTP